MSDPNWASRISLLPFDGSIADSKGPVWTAVGGTPAFVTGPFASTQALGGSPAGARVQAPTTAQANFGTANIAIEFWFQGTAASGKAPFLVFSSMPAAANNGIRLMIYADSAAPTAPAGTLQFDAPQIGVATKQTTGVNLCDGAPHFVQVVRVGSAMTMSVGNIGDANTTNYFSQSIVGSFSNTGFVAPGIGQEPFLTTYSPLEGLANFRTTTGTPVATLPTAVPTAKWPEGAPPVANVLNATPRAIAVAAPSAAMRVARLLGASPAAYVVGTATANIGLGATLGGGGAAAYAVSAPNASLAFVPSTSGYFLGATPAAYAVAAAPGGLSLAASFAVSPVAYAASTPAATMGAAFGLGGAPAGYAVAALPGAMLGSFGLTAAPASYAVAAPSGLLGLSLGLGGAPAAYSVTAPGGQLALASTLQAAAAVYPVAASSAALGLATGLGATPAAYAVNAAPASLGFASTLQVAPASYSVATPAASLTFFHTVVYPPTRWIYWTVPAEVRSYSVAGESRNAVVSGDSRIYTVDGEARVATIQGESRNFKVRR